MPIAVSVDSAYARIRITVTSATNDTIEIWRSGAGEVVPVRNADPAEPVAGTFEVYDYEAPFGKPVFYTLDDGGTMTNSSTVTLNVSRAWIKVPFFPTQNLTATLITMPSFSRSRPKGVHPVLGRAKPIVITGKMGSRTGTLDLLTGSVESGEALLDLLDSTGVVLLQVPGSRWGQVWCSIGDVTETPVTKLTGEDAVRWQIELIEVDRPQGILIGNPTATYDSLRTGVTTYQVLKTTKTNYTAVLRSVGAPIVPPEPGGF